VEVACGPEYASLPPSQIVPRLADAGIYLATSRPSTGAEARNLQHHRGVPRPHARVCRHVTAPRVATNLDLGYHLLPGRSPACSTTSTWCWICIRARSWAGEVFAEENAEHASQVIRKASLAEAGAQVNDIALGQWEPDKADDARDVAQAGHRPLVQRPGVSDDNAQVEAFFRTLKYRPAYPRRDSPRRGGAQLGMKFVRCTTASTGTRP